MKSSMNSRLKNLEKTIYPMIEDPDLIDHLSVKLAVSTSDYELLRQCVGRYGEEYKENAEKKIEESVEYYKSLLNGVGYIKEVQDIGKSCGKFYQITDSDCFKVLQVIEPNQWQFIKNRIIRKQEQE